jgi:penicillin G amidase
VGFDALEFKGRALAKRPLWQRAWQRCKTYRMPRWLKWLSFSATALLLITTISIYLLLRTSLPRYEGQLITGVSTEVLIERDALGTAIIHAKSRHDAYFAQGFVHAQERFFQMDLARRNAAGELAELFGERALVRDQAVRPHQLRKRMQENFARFGAEERLVLAHYTAGVNAGLKDLGAKPFEYHLLRAEIKPWQEVDTLLASASMMLGLQDHQNKMELQADFAQRTLHRSAYQYLFYRGSAAIDAPLFDAPIADPAIPSAAELDLRALPDSAFAANPAALGDPEALRGSNNWAVGGALTAHKSAMLANDMHLGLGVPSVWFRQQLNYPDPENVGAMLQITGVSLPGAPASVVASNGHIAWGITNSYGDWLDFVRLDDFNAGDNTYQIAGGRELLTLIDDEILIKGSAAVKIQIQQSRYGPVVGKDSAGHPLALAWVAHRAGGIDTKLTNLELLKSTEAALELVQQAGMPHSNIVAVDKSGAIGWATGGRIPLRSGTGDGDFEPDLDQSAHSVPVGSSQLQGDVWTGWRSGAPTLVNPPAARIWTANSRVVDANGLNFIGNAGYALGQRSARIKEKLFARNQFSEADFLAIQLDEEAPLLERWWQRMSQTLAREPKLADREIINTILSDWNRRASPESRSYRLVRNTRLRILEIVTRGLAAPMRAKNPAFELSFPAQAEAIVWPLLITQPAHLLPKPYSSWAELEQSALLDAFAKLKASGDPLDRNFGEYNTARIQHPLSRSIPGLGWFLDMPADPLPGDTGHVVRAQGPSFGASQRLVVAPSHEAQGLFHMSGGQSGHPLSDYFGAGHSDWVRGSASPLLPGAARHRLTLLPQN